MNGFYEKKTLATVENKRNTLTNFSVEKEINFFQRIHRKGPTAKINTMYYEFGV